MSRAPAATDLVLADLLLRTIGRLRRVFWSEAAIILEQYEESIFAWQLLVLAVQHGEVSQQELIRLSAQHPTVVSRVLDDLEKRRLISRVRDAADRRRCLISVTPAGRRRYDRIRPEILRATDRTLDRLTASERSQLGVLLGKLLTP